ASERFSYAKCLFVDTVETVRRERLVFAKAIVKNSRSGPKYRLRRFGRSGRTGRPRKCKAGRKIQLTAGVVLDFIAQAKTKSHIWLVTPIVLHIRFNIKLADAGDWIARVNTELGGASALCANLGRRQVRCH